MRLASSLFFYIPYQFIVVGYSLFHAFRNVEFRRTLKERIFLQDEIVQNKNRKRVWVHSASVGEVRGVVPYVDMLLSSTLDLQLIFTTTSATGKEEVEKLYPDRFVSLLPLDLSSLMSRFMKKHQPDLVIINETEIWPQLFTQSQKLGIPLIIVNGRISDRTFGNYLRLKPLFTNLLNKIDLIAVQSDLDKERFIRIGANAKSVTVAGNTKFDTDIEVVDRYTEEMLEKFKSLTKYSLSFGSVREEEEEIVISTIKTLLTQSISCSFFIAPRHPKRFNAFYEKLLRLNIPILRRSNSNLTDVEALDTSSIFYLDTLGQMLAIYKASSIAFVGGTYSKVGGHNILEPAYFSTAIVVGPRVEAQREGFNALNQKKAIFIVPDSAELGGRLIELLRAEEMVIDSGRLAHQAYLELRGASNRLYSLTEKYFTEGS